MLDRQVARSRKVVQTQEVNQDHKRSTEGIMELKRKALYPVRLEGAHWGEDDELVWVWTITKGELKGREVPYQDRERRQEAPPYSYCSRVFEGRGLLDTEKLNGRKATLVVEELIRPKILAVTARKRTPPPLWVDDTDLDKHFPDPDPKVYSHWMGRP